MIYDALGIDVTEPINLAHDLNRGRVAWWLTLPQSAGGPRLYDLSGFHHGNLLSETFGNPLSGPTWKVGDRPGGYGHLNFVGPEAYIEVSDGPRLRIAGSLTLAVWARFSSFNNSAQGLIVKDFAAAGRGYGLYRSYTSNTLVEFRARIGGTWSGAEDPTGRNDGLWHRYHGVYDLAAGRQYLYTDGVLVATTVVSGALSTSTDPLQLGKWSGGGGNDHLTGDLDDAGVWSRALSAAEVAAEYDQSRRGHPDTLNRISGVRAFLFASAPPPSATAYPASLLMMSC